MARPPIQTAIDQAYLIEHKIWIFTDMHVTKDGIAMFNFTVKFTPTSYRPHLTWGEYLESKTSSFKYFSQAEALQYGLKWSQQYI